MTNLTIFNFENTPVQTIVENNEIFFRAAQLAELLEYKNPHDALRKHVDPDDLAKREIVNIANKRAQVLFVNESGMYSLILGSKLESAKRVKRWVTSEVLPQIRKTGSYALQNTQLNLPLAEIQADEEALQIIVNLYHSLREAHEFAVLAHDVDHRWLKQNIDKDLGGHLLHNLNRPAKNALDKAKKYIHAKSERIMFVKGMLSLLEAPKTKRIANF